MAATATADSSHRRRVLGLFAKQPLPGQAKTRLAAATSAEWAARVAEAFLLDTVAKLAEVNAERLLAFAPASAQEYFANLPLTPTPLPHTGGRGRGEGVREPLA